MGSVLLLAIGVAVASLILGSILFQFLTPNLNDPFGMDLEEKCETIAKEGYLFHLRYPEFTPDQLPTGDQNRLEYLDEMWIKDCVSKLPAESIFNIIQKVERDFHSEQ